MVIYKAVRDFIDNITSTGMSHSREGDKKSKIRRTNIYV